MKRKKQVLPNHFRHLEQTIAKQQEITQLQSQNPQLRQQFQKHLVKKLQINYQLQQ